MINTIIFDIGGVLVGYDWKAFLLKEFNNDIPLVTRIADNVFKSWDEVDRGVLSEEELLDLFCKDAPDIREEIIHFWETLGGALWQYDFTKDWLRDLKNRGYRILYLSNWSHHVKECCKEQMDFLSMMDGGVFSYKVKLIKPDHAIFKEIIKRYNLTPSECVFLDDRLDNCQAAIACDMNAIQVVDHQTAVDELEKLLNK